MVYKPFYFFLFLILSLSFIKADLNTGFPDDDNELFVSITRPTATTTTTTNNTNSSEYWVTDIGSLDNANATQFDNNDETLSIDTSWLSSFGNAIWCKLTGCTMDGDIDMGGNDITNTDEITANTFVGDGSGLTNLPGGSDNDFHIFFNGSAYNNINYNLTDGDVNDINTPVEPGRKFIFGEVFT